MPDREKVIEGLEHLRETIRTATQYTFTSGGICAMNMKRIDNAIALLKEQETTSTGKTRIFQCEKCGYGFDDIYLSNEHDFDVYPRFCPNCGRSVKWDA